MPKQRVSATLCVLFCPSINSTIFYLVGHCMLTLCFGLIRPAGQLWNLRSQLQSLVLLLLEKSTCLLLITTATKSQRARLKMICCTLCAASNSTPAGLILAAKKGPVALAFPCPCKLTARLNKLVQTYAGPITAPPKIANLSCHTTQQLLPCGEVSPFAAITARF